jgi:hypothetical protein
MRFDETLFQQSLLAVPQGGFDWGRVFNVAVTLKGRQPRQTTALVRREPDAGWKWISLEAGPLAQEEFLRLYDKRGAVDNHLKPAILDFAERYGWLRGPTQLTFTAQPRPSEHPVEAEPLSDWVTEIRDFGEINGVWAACQEGSADQHLLQEHIEWKRDSVHFHAHNGRHLIAPGNCSPEIFRTWKKENLLEPAKHHVIALVQTKLDEVSPSFVWVDKKYYRCLRPKTLRAAIWFQFYMDMFSTVNIASACPKCGRAVVFQRRRKGLCRTCRDRIRKGLWRKNKGGGGNE